MFNKIIGPAQTHRKISLNDRETKNRVQTERNVFDGSRQVLYDNRVLHINKKFMIPKEEKQFIQKTNVQAQKIKREGEFRRYVQLVVRNQALCRRGPFDVPVKSMIPANFKIKRIKTQSQHQGRGNYTSQLKSRRVYNEAVASSMTSAGSFKKYSYASQRKFQQKKRKELPNLGISSEIQKWQPIQVDKFISKSSTRVDELSERDRRNQTKNLMLRRIDVQSINNNLLRMKTEY